MNITECYDIDSIIRGLETALLIDGPDFEERDINTVIKNVKTRIGRQYQIDLTGTKIDDTELEMGVYRSAVSLFVDNIARIHSKLCGFGQIARYLTNIQISLSNINYLGYTEESLKSVLIALQRRATLPMAEDAINAVKLKLGTINNCREKRLFMLIVIAHELGFNEITAAIAELLYLSSVEEGKYESRYREE